MNYLDIAAAERVKVEAKNAFKTYEIWWKGEKIDSFDSEREAKQNVNEYARAFKTQPSAFTIKEV